jgi:hypothetical protein
MTTAEFSGFSGAKAEYKGLKADIHFVCGDWQGMWWLATVGKRKKRFKMATHAQEFETLKESQGMVRGGIAAAPGQGVKPLFLSGKREPYLSS